jgi:peptidoglycan/LPS O-acetylase OafA/YrhL
MSVSSLDRRRGSYSARQRSCEPNDINTGSHHEKLPKSATVYYPWFDWLRAVLAITVMLGHDRLIPWAHSGNFAVRVFFALSGWLIGGMLMNTPRQHLTRFYFNRAVRIWVPYYLALALLLGASLLQQPAVTAKWFEVVIYKMTFVYNLFGQSQLGRYADLMPLRGTGNHFWTVNAEEQFYLLAPLLLVIAPPRFGRSPIVWILLALATLVSSQYSTVIVGVAAAVTARAYPGIFSGRRVRIAIVALAIVLAAALSFAETHDLAQLYGVARAYEALSPLLSICIVLSLAVEGPRQSIAVVAGGMSYPLYLNHWIGGYVARALLTPYGLRESVITHVVSNSLNLVLAVGLYWYVDRQLLLHRSRFYTARRGLIVTRIAYATMVVGLTFGVVLMLQRSH